MIKQDLSPEPRFQRHQFGLDVLAKNLDPSTIVFSDEFRFVLGIDKQWQHIRQPFGFLIE
jgi:transposase-like protein